MRAVTYDRYGGPRTHRLRNDAPVPTPGAGQIAVDVKAAGINPYDWHIYRADPFLVRIMFGMRSPGPRTVGSDLAGVVRAVGEGVTDVAVGDRVAGFAGFGAAADVAVLGVDRVAVIPPGVTDAQAAATPVGALTALLGLEPLEIPGKAVLVIGASGGVGHMAVQIARALGARRVVGVCSGRNAEMVRSLGADRVIDYTCESVLDCAEQFDVVFDNVATTRLRPLRRIMKPKAVYAPAGAVGGGRLLGPGGPRYRSVLAGLTVSQRVAPVSARENGISAEMARLLAWVDEGTITPVIEKVYPLEQHAEAFERLESQRVAGKLVLQVNA